MKRPSASTDPIEKTPRLGSPRRMAWWPLAAVICVGVLVYANSFAGPFIFDDYGSIVTPARSRVLNPGSLIVPVPPHSPLAGRPLANLTFGLNYALGGLDTGGYHAFNLVLHLVCGLLTFALIQRSCSRTIATATALIWTVHPLNSEVVDYLTERTESLMALCYLGTVYASTRAFSSARSGLWKVGAVSICALGALCKETIVTAPVTVLLYDGCFTFSSIRTAIVRRWRFYLSLATSWLLLLVSLRIGITWAGRRLCDREHVCSSVLAQSGGSTHALFASRILAARSRP